MNIWQNSAEAPEEGKMMEYPKERKLDGVFIRIKRDDSWCNICFSDMTAEEREEAIEGKSLEWVKSLAYRLADVIREIGDLTDIEKVYTYEEE